MIVELAKGAALLLSLCLLHGFVHRYWPRNEGTGQAVSGLIFGGIVIIGMNAPITLVPGVIFDARSVVLSMAGLFGGPLVGGIAGLIGGGYRAWLGGAGAPVGVTVAVTCVLLGLGYRFCVQRGWVTVGFWQLLVFGFAVHLWVILVFTFLPEPVAEKVMDTLAVPFVATFAPATAFLGILLKMVEAYVQAAAKLKESEARFRDYAVSSSDWFWETDEDHRFTFFSGRLGEILGYDPAGMIGKRREEVAADGGDVDWSRHWRHLDDHLPFRGFQYSLTNADGQRLTVSVNGTPVFNETGKFLGYRGTSTDITNQKLAEAARDAALRQARKASDAKTDFLAKMSHELRTPLNAILGFSDILRNEYFGPVGSELYRGYVDDVHISAQHLLALVEDLLDVSAIESGRRQFDPEELISSDLIEETVRTVRSRAKPKDIKVEYQLPHDPVRIFAEKRAMKQIMFNLLSNAIKFTPEGGRVRVVASNDGRNFSIVVSDTGRGMHTEELGSALDMMHSTNGQSWTTDTGWGLGLAITKALVELHDGYMTIESSPENGTRVTVSMPIVVSGTMHRIFA